ncbi:MAG: ATP-binding cassette domain-containing protein [Deinococcota bacterium]|nr:ATP-binding cassette domain-containing protein [Deinococcota bacterium]
MSADVAIYVEGVHKSFGKVRALSGVDLAAPAGKVFGLLGPNGAGKTTLVRILTTLLRPDSGRASVAGLDVAKDADRLRGIIGLAGQYAAVDENLTGRENLEMVGRLYHLGGREAKRRADEVLSRFALEDAANRTVKTYSGGMRRRLDLGASLVGRPQVLFLDEPTTGLDPRTRLELWDLIGEIVHGGATLLLTTQYLEEADELADRVAVIDDGRVIAEGTTDELKSRLGGDVLELRLAANTRLDDALRALAPVGTERPRHDPATGMITLPVSNGAQSLIEAVRQLDEAGAVLADLSLRRPSLDDVFLALTGQSTRVQKDEPVAATGPIDERRSARRSR